jgi:hypothetical protein
MRCHAFCHLCIQPLPRFCFASWPENYFRCEFHQADLFTSSELVVLLHCLQDVGPRLVHGWVLKQAILSILLKAELVLKLRHSQLVPCSKPPNNWRMQGKMN